MTPRDLYRAVEVMHEWNVSQDAEIRRKGRYLCRASGLLILFVLGFAWLAVYFDYMLGSLLFQDANFEEAARQGALVLLVLLVGGFGAVFSVLFSVFQQIETNSTDPSIPSTVFVSETLLLRVLVGSTGSLVLIVLFQGAGDVVNHEFLLRESNGDQVVDWAKIASLAFLAGFSERVLKGYLDKFVRSATPSEE